MTLGELINTLPFPIGIELFDDEVKAIRKTRTNEAWLKNFHNMPVVRWWPETKDSIVVFIPKIEPWKKGE